VICFHIDHVFAPTAQRFALGRTLVAHIDRRIGALVTDIVVAIVDNIAGYRLGRARRQDERGACEQKTADQWPHGRLPC
jgi:hypothetical protein